MFGRECPGHDKASPTRVGGSSGLIRPKPGILQNVPNRERNKIVVVKRRLGRDGISFLTYSQVEIG